MKYAVALTAASRRVVFALLTLSLFAFVAGCDPSHPADSANNDKEGEEKEVAFTEAEKLENEKENRTLYVKITGNVNYEGYTHANGKFTINSAGQLVGLGVSGSIDTKELDGNVGFGCLMPIEGVKNAVLLSSGQEVKASMKDGASGTLTRYLSENDSEGRPKREYYNALGDALCYSSDPDGSQTFLDIHIEKAERLKTDSSIMGHSYTYRIKGKASFNATASRQEKATLEHWEDIQKRKAQGITPLADPSWLDAVRVHVEMSFDFEATGLDYDELAKSLQK